MSSGCGDVLSLEDLKTAKKHQVFEAEVVTGKAGGVAGGVDIDEATNAVTGQVQKTIPAVLRDVGFDRAAFDFTSGGILGSTDRDKVVYNPVDNNWYSWSGTLPHVVAAGTDPLADSNWIPRTDELLRGDLASSEADLGLSLVGFSYGNISPQSAYRAADYLRNWVVFDGYFENSAAGLLAAVESMRNSDGVIDGTLYIPRGVNVNLDSSVTIDCGQNPFGGTERTTAQRCANLRIICNGSIKCVGGIGDGIFLKEAFHPAIQLRFVNGGSSVDTDCGLRVGRTLGGVYHLTGEYFSGTLLKHYTVADGRWQEVSDIMINARFCGRAIYLQGGSSGFGRFSSVWNIMPSYKDVLYRMADVTFDHYESTTGSDFTDATIQITEGSSYHFKNLCCGEGSGDSGFIRIEKVEEVYIDEGFVWGGSSDSGTDTGIYCRDSTMRIGHIRAGHCRYGILIDGGSKVTVSSFSGNANTNDVALVKQSTDSTSSEVEIGLIQSSSAIAESIVVSSSITGGQLIISGGSIQGGNTGAGATYAIDAYGGNSFRVGLSDLYVSGSYTKSLRVNNYALFKSSGMCLFVNGMISTTLSGWSVDGKTAYVPPAVSTAALNTNYQNNTGGSLFVSVPVQINSGGSATVYLVVTDTDGAEYIVDRFNSGDTGIIRNLQAIIGAGYSYKVTTTNAEVVTPLSGVRTFRI